MKKIDLSLVLACYNEGRTLKWSLDNIREVLEGTKYTWEVICIDDCSKDSTYENLQKYQVNNPKFKVFKHQQNLGRGGTVSEGIKLAVGTVVGFIDVDLETSAIYIPKFVSEINKGADVAIATRIEVNGLQALARWVTSQIYIILVRTLLGLKFKDTEAGYKFFNRNKILKVLNEVEDKKWFFDTEIVARSFWSGLKIKEIPVIFIRRPEKASTVRLIPDSIEYLKRILAFKYKFIN